MTITRERKVGRLYLAAVFAAMLVGLWSGFSAPVNADGPCASGCCKDRVTCGGSQWHCCAVPPGELPCDATNDCPGVCDLQGCPG